jgi:hypothetical protein
VFKPNSVPTRIIGVAEAWTDSPSILVGTAKQHCHSNHRFGNSQSSQSYIQQSIKQQQLSLPGVQLMMGLSSPSSSFAEEEGSNGTTATTTNRSTTTVARTIESSSSPKPRLPIPDPIYSNIPGTWAYDTMSRRVDEEILQRTWDDNKEVWTAGDDNGNNNNNNDNKFKSVVDRFNALRMDLRSSAPLRMLEAIVPASGTTTTDEMESAEREWEEWKAILDPFLEKNDTWLTAPWMVTEFYVYRRMIEATGFWDKDSPGYQYDPFAKQKRAGLESSVGSAEPMLGKIPDLPRDSSDGINLAASIALWGNKMDLSLWPADAGNTNVDVFSSILDRAQENLLHDDSSALSAHCETLREKGGGDVDIIVDNAGFELITDLALAQYLIDSGIASCVTFQLKSHPTFVSDALEKDLVEHVDHYLNLDKALYPNAQQSGEKWKGYLRDGKWKCHEDNFWVQAFAMWDITEPLRTDLKNRCDLAFVKGDANYRRLLGTYDAAGLSMPS